MGGRWPSGGAAMSKQRDELVEFVSKNIPVGEQTVAVGTTAIRPKPPTIVPLPLVGIALMLNRRYQVYGLVVTEEQVVVRRSRLHRGRPKILPPGPADPRFTSPTGKPTART